MQHESPMTGFPPEPSGQVTLANWRTPPFNRWAFQHVREIVPSAEIANDPDRVWTLPHAPRDLSGLRIADGDLAAFLEGTDTDRADVFVDVLALAHEVAGDLQAKQIDP